MGACNFVDANVSTWLPCVQESMFFDEPLLMAFAGYLIIAVLIYKFRIPGTLALPLGIVYTVGLYTMNPMPQTFVLLLVAVMLGFGWMGLAIINAFRRG